MRTVSKMGTTVIRQIGGVVRRRDAWKFVLAAGLAAVLVPPHAGAQEKPAAAGTDEYIVTFDRDAVSNPSATTQALEQRRDFDATHVYRSAIEGFSADLD